MLFVADFHPVAVGHIMHELMHALGFHHEHNRPDRGAYVIIEIDENENANYKKLVESQMICIGHYDYESVMHYPLSQYMTSPLRFIITFPLGFKIIFPFGIIIIFSLGSLKIVKIGQREKLSNGDIDALNKHYPREEILRSRKEELERREEELERRKKEFERGKEEFERVSKRSLVDNERKERLEKILVERNDMKLPQTSGPSM